MEKPTPGNNTRTVSVVIPVYNVASYLREALDSVVNQTYKALQILVIDDGSMDRSGAICDDYASRDPRITVIHQEHQNVSVARNTALDLATGDFIAFLDPDDAFHPSFIQVMLDTILREKTDIVICKYKIYQTEKKMRLGKHGAVFTSIKPGAYNRTQALDSLISGKIGVAIWDKLYKREVWNDVRFPNDLYAASDHVVSYQVFFNFNSVYVIDKPLYMYRKRPGSLTAIHPDKIVRSRLHARTYVSDFLCLHSPEVFSEQQIRCHEESIFGAAINYYANCYKREGSEYLKKQITDMADKIGIENCGYKARVKYYLMRMSPWLLKHVNHRKQWSICVTNYQPMSLSNEQYHNQRTKPDSQTEGK